MPQEAQEKTDIQELLDQWAHEDIQASQVQWDQRETPDLLALQVKSGPRAQKDHQARPPVLSKMLFKDPLDHQDRPELKVTEDR